MSVLDTACARVAVSQHAVPAEVDDSRRRIEALDTELQIIDRDETAGYDVTDRRATIRDVKVKEEARLADLTLRWDAEKTIVEAILDLSARLREGAAPVGKPAGATGAEAPPPEGNSPLTAEDRARLTAELRPSNADLTALQGDSPLIPPALLGRLVVIPYYPLSPDMIGKITRLQLNRIKKRVEAAHSVPFAYSDAVVDLIVSRCQEVESGGRMIDAIVTNTMLPDISGEFLRRMIAGAAMKQVALDVKDGNFTYSFD